MNLLKVGDHAPAFSAFDQDGQTVSLADFAGRTVVLFFYPKDDTPGCTKEACAFRDRVELFRRNEVEVLGVSVDPVSSHRKFSTKYGIPFRLLADPEKTMVTSYGVWAEKKQYGRTYMGTHRVTYVIDGNGKIASVFPKVKPDAHADEVLQSLDILA